VPSPPKENRRRRNADLYAGLQVSVKATEDELEPVEPFLRGTLARTREWYRTWESAPQTQVFTPTDWQRLRVMVPLVDQYFRHPSASLMAEIRQNESLMGATHADRLRARMKVEKAAPEEVPEGVPSLAEYRERLAG